MSPKDTRMNERPAPPFTTADKAAEEVQEAQWNDWGQPDALEVRPLTPDERLMEVFEDGANSGFAVKREPQTDGKRVDWHQKSRLKEQ